MEVQLTGRRRSQRRRQSQRGFSLVEALIAAGLMLIIVLGILPLFTGAIRSNATGRDYMEVNNLARSHAEELFQLQFNDLPVGTTNEFFSHKDQIWKAGSKTSLPAGEVADYFRTTVLRQYNIKDLNTPMPAGSPTESVHLKEIEVMVETANTSGGPLGPAKRTTVRLWKSV